MPFRARIVVALDSFKGSITAADAARALADGWHTARPDDEVIVCPMADGGEGTLAAFEAAVGGARRIPVRVTGPDGLEHNADWLRLPGDVAVVELASTSGIELLGPARHPWDADTTGFGQAIAAALDAGAQRLILGIGSSASTDGGTGLLRALGARFLDADGAPVARGARGLADMVTADLRALRPLPAGGVTVLSDVTSPLTGSTGSAAVFGPQKGLGPADIATVDAALAHLARVCNAEQIADAAGAGAAGGAGFALLLWGAQLAAGADAVAELVGLASLLEEADIVVTGEGAYDGQSAAGKVPTAVASLAAARAAAVHLVAGRIDPDADTSRFAATASLVELAGSAASALAEPAHWLRVAGAELAAHAAPGDTRAALSSSENGPDGAH